MMSRIELSKNTTLRFEFFICDEKALKTVVRSNPGALQLEKGTVQQKVHWNDIDEFRIIKFGQLHCKKNSQHLHHTLWCNYCYFFSI